MAVAAKYVSISIPSILAKGREVGRDTQNGANARVVAPWPLHLLGCKEMRVQSTYGSWEVFLVVATA